jgi:dipeptidase E
MKLYLSSYHFGDHPQQFSDLIGNNKNIAIIPNALDWSTDLPRRTASLQQEKDGLLQLYLQPDELDLRNYFGKPEELKRKMSEYGAVWVVGGNTFVLRRAYKQSGMDTWLRENITNQEFVYGGYSAGICVLTQDLKNIELMDEPKIVPEGYDSKIIWEGVGLVDFAIVPHYLSNHPESESASREVDYLVKKVPNIKPFMTAKLLL